MDTSANAIWKYSGGGYTILQLLIEEVSQTSFAEFMEKEIFVPLNMKYSSFDITNCIEKHSAQPYDEDGKAIPFRYFTAQAAAGLHTTLADLLHFFQASLNKNPVISQLSIQELIKPTTISNKKYGMGYMMINDFGNFTLIGHAGSNEGWQAVLLQDFATKSGIIMLTNGSNGKNVLFQGLKIWAKWRS
jgi:CubicO group peptidase (beta-lactamase class C family)